MQDGGPLMNTTSSNNTGKLLVTVMEKHRCDEAMAAARKAGASGGTVILGRGTAESRPARLVPWFPVQLPSSN